MIENKFEESTIFNPKKNSSEKLDIKIELAVPDDWELYKDITLDLLKNNPEVLGSSVEQRIKDSPSQWRMELSNPGTFTMFAKNQQPIVSVESMATAINKGENRWQIISVYTRPNFRGKGIVNEILNNTTEEIKKRGGTLATLIVSKDPKQVAARSVYEKLGFKVLEESNFDYYIGKELL